MVAERTSVGKSLVACRTVVDFSGLFRLVLFRKRITFLLIRMGYRSGSVACYWVMRYEKGSVVSKGRIQIPVVTRYRQGEKRIGGIIKIRTRKGKRRDKGIGRAIIKVPVIRLWGYAAADRK